MDIYAYIKRDHLAVADLMQQLLDIRLTAFHRRLFDQIRTELTVHTAAEEQTFYAAIEAAEAGPMTEEEMVHAHYEHDEIRDLMDDLAQISENDEMWLVKFGELKHAVEHHVHQEETDVWARARKVLTPEQAVQLAKDMDRVKQRMMNELIVPAQ